MKHNECGKVAVDLAPDEAFDWLFKGLNRRICMSCGGALVAWTDGFGGVEPMIYS